jgi:hypothetical protein
MDGNNAVTRLPGQIVPIPARACARVGRASGRDDGGLGVDALAIIQDHTPQPPIPELQSHNPAMHPDADLLFLNEPAQGLGHLVGVIALRKHPTTPLYDRRHALCRKERHQLGRKEAGERVPQKEMRMVVCVRKGKMGQEFA